MTDRRVTFNFAFNSPYSFFAGRRVDDLLAPLDLAIDALPIYRPASVGGGPDFSSPKMQYLLQDVRRFARHYGLTLDPGPFADTGKACRAYLLADGAGQGVPFRSAIFAARWLEGKDVGAPEMVAEAGAACGLDAAAIAAAMADDSPEAERLGKISVEAETAGAFGVPFFIYGEQKFWGNDRLDWLVRAIEAGAAA